MVTAIQLTAHYVNEYADAESDRTVTNRTLFSGGSGVISGGRLDPVVAVTAGRVTTAIALGLIVALAYQSPAAAGIGLLALAIAWAYSIPPWRLLSTGWGEIATSTLVAGGVPLVGSLAQGATPSVSLWWSIAILIPTHTAMMLAFELPDRDSDSAAGKLVLAVRIGIRSTRRAIYSLVIGAAAVVVAAGLSGELMGNSLAWMIPAGSAATTTLILLGSSRHLLLTASAVAMLALAAVGLIVGLSL